MMQTPRLDRIVDAPVDHAFAVLGDLASIAIWGPDIDHAWICTEVRQGVGAIRRVQTGRMAVLEEVVRWEPPHVLAYRIDGLPKVVRSLLTTWTLAEGPETGLTEVAVQTTVDCGPRPPQQLVARLVAKRFASVNRGLLDGLVTHLTTEPRSIP